MNYEVQRQNREWRLNVRRRDHERLKAALCVIGTFLLLSGLLHWGLKK
jgi:hypothetical protein